MSVQWVALSRGDAPFPVRTGSLGRVTGSSSAGTGTGPHELQCTMGIGVPQYRCLEISQSRSLGLVRWPPTPFSRAFCMMLLKASRLLRPVNWKDRKLYS